MAGHACARCKSTGVKKLQLIGVSCRRCPSRRSFLHRCRSPYFPAATGPDSSFGTTQPASKSCVSQYLWISLSNRDKCVSPALYYSVSQRVNTCPKCNKKELIRRLDASSGYVECVCLACKYYESDSEAFAVSPSLFTDLGKELISCIMEPLRANGLNYEEARGWLRNEPVFYRSITLPLHRKSNKTSGLPRTPSN
jgi:ribosomal protein L37AE/L43A